MNVGLLNVQKKTDWFFNNQSVFFCSYFIHLDKELCDNGTFYSYQWDMLPKFLHDRGIKTNWIQHYLPSSVVPNTGVALNWLKRFNEKRHEHGFHIFLESYLSWHIIFNVLCRWLKLKIVSWRLRKIKEIFTPKDSKLNLWTFMSNEWHNSMSGPVAIRNLLFIELFDKALCDIPQQNKGVYLCENQSWEKALIHAWRKHGHGQLVAVAHATVRFWDMRYYADPRTIRSSDLYPMPKADLIALNGKVAVDAFLGADYPKEEIVECEALRYGYLNDNHANDSENLVLEDTIKVLILGDYLPSVMIKMFELLIAAVPHISKCINYTVKPHPHNLIKAEDYPSLNLKIVLEPLGEILYDFNIVYSSNTTSAQVDACFSGLPVAVMLDDTTLNFSPLHEQSNVSFISTSEELADALQMFDCGKIIKSDPNEFFFLDPELSRWQRIL